MAFEVKLDQFSGPLQLLLDLIEAAELEITEVSLAQVTEDYLEHLEKEKPPAEELADFLVVATKLLLIKSKAILPELHLEEEEDASTLALQLKMYKEFVDASKLIEERYGKSIMMPRPRVSVPKSEGFSPPEEVNPNVLRDTFAKMLKRLEPFFALQQKSIEKVVSIQQRVSQIRDAILERSRMTFKQVVKGGNRVDVVVSFLALLELVKQKIVSASQDNTFNEINITKAD